MIYFSSNEISHILYCRLHRPKTFAILLNDSDEEN